MKWLACASGTVKLGAPRHSHHTPSLDALPLVDRAGQCWNASGLDIAQASGGRRLSYFRLPDQISGPALPAAIVQLRVAVHDATADHSYSVDVGRSFQPLGRSTPIRASWWKGPRPALFAYTTAPTQPGSVDFDWVQYEAIGANAW